MSRYRDRFSVVVRLARIAFDLSTVLLFVTLIELAVFGPSGSLIANATAYLSIAVMLLLVVLNMFLVLRRQATVWQALSKLERWLVVLPVIGTVVACVIDPAHWAMYTFYATLGCANLALNWWIERRNRHSLTYFPPDWSGHDR